MTPEQIERYKNAFAKRYPTKKSFYASRRWQRIRQAVLKRDNYLCQNCLRFGIKTQAEHVHHKIHLEDDVTKAFDMDNLISLCRACHNEMHPEKIEHASIKGRLGYYEIKRKRDER